MPAVATRGVYLLAMLVLYECCSRAPTNNSHLRELFCGMDSSSHATALQGCVSSLRSSMQMLDSSITILDAGVSDYPRLAKVLKATRVGESQCSR